MSESKAESLNKRLKEINPNIKFYTEFITRENIEKIVEGYEIAINALDFTNEISLVFDELCPKKVMYILHPYNLGWGVGHCHRFTKSIIKYFDKR